MEDGKTPVALTIAGSDSGGGAGIQADLKAFARCGVHGCSALTALTAQNTVGVSEVRQMDPDMIAAQVESVVGDIGVDAVKIGMLGSGETARAVANCLGDLQAVPIVIDPVMISESGARLLEPAALEVLTADLIPRASVITPNLPEAAALLGVEGEVDESDQEQLARDLLTLGPDAVIVTGGHTLTGDDLLFDGETVQRISGPRHPDGAAHGSGCTHSSALAASFALGLDLPSCARVARAVASEAVALGPRDIGRGPGPVSSLDLAAGRAWARSVADGASASTA